MTLKKIKIEQFPRIILKPQEIGLEPIIFGFGDQYSAIKILSPFSIKSGGNRN
jgi:hypothetical protein